MDTVDQILFCDDLTDMYNTALVFTLSGRKVGDGNEFSTKAKGTGCGAAKPFRRLLKGECTPLRWLRPGNIENVRTISLWKTGTVNRSGRFIGVLDGMDSDRAIKEGGGEKIWVTRTPIDLERPVVTRRKLR